MLIKRGYSLSYEVAAPSGNTFVRTVIAVANTPDLAKYMLRLSLGKMDLIVFLAEAVDVITDA